MEDKETVTKETTIPELLPLLVNCTEKEEALALFVRASDRFIRLVDRLKSIHVDEVPFDFAKEKQAMDIMCDWMNLTFGNKKTPDTADQFAARAKAILVIPSMKERIANIKPDTADKEALLKETDQRLDVLLANLRAGVAKSPEFELMNYDRILRWLEGATVFI